jgi:hypothetical protein
MPSIRSRGSTHYKPIGPYGIVGDLETVALVSMDASLVEEPSGPQCQMNQSFGTQPLPGT